MKNCRLPPYNMTLHGLLTVMMLLCGVYLLSIDLETIQKGLGYAPFKDNNDSTIQVSHYPWIETDGVTLSQIVGNPSVCKDVIYTGDSRDPFGATVEDKGIRMIKSGWKGTSHLIRNAPALQGNTCFAFYRVASSWIHEGKELHPVWGRLPATALVMSAFPKAEVFLYMDSDALLAFPDKSPTDMYKALAFDGYGENPTMQQLQPGLVVNKPLTGWLCGQCEKYKLGHGCFNTGALVWHRGPSAELVLQKWWESRLNDRSQNFVAEEDEDGFHGWTRDGELPADKMSEQNRLMYIFNTDEEVRAAVWPVPRQKSEEFDSESCPNKVDADHMPCLQTEFIHGAKWDSAEPSCFIHHYADDKEDVKDHSKLMLTYGESKERRRS